MSQDTPAHKVIAVIKVGTKTYTTYGHNDIPLFTVITKLGKQAKVDIVDTIPAPSMPNHFLNDVGTAQARGTNMP